MDSSKILEDTEECSSNESGWTMYIASPVHELGYDDYEDEEYCSTDEQIYERDGAGREDGDVDSDDSMASDASSGPSYQGQSYGFRGFGHAWNKSQNKHVDEKNHKQEEEKHFKQKKAAKDKFECDKISVKKLKNK
ncbi:ATPase family AAA domain-containing protein 2 [Dorcoceras hygrometricum]|uniref:ATPase family AAA domain-containing protein 2 n=1 Tax=Dorcoceras hygrometricum TaxID=472368 RepID=A0A2Z7AZL6_9LAMI|nr:ATPase family AAA domain-containing protein 2 [Dorcoceras hygrometricum]